MLRLVFAKIKGHKSYANLTIFLKEEVSYIVKDKEIEITCPSKLAYKDLTKFLKKYVFDSLSTDDNLKVYVPKDYVKSFREVKSIF